MDWKLFLKWFDRFGEWIGEIVTAVKKRNAINAINKVESAIDDDTDAVILDELRRITKKVEDRKKLG